ncbi:uncharacterized protein [Gossypium hirsutum]|uniref:Uncharacterized protein n=1 Tax=Gossypium hirsutum TaxID=3635 RepID=A0A1U8KP99_GOSHI|nr:uncharacterized protein LOC107919334 [Gossypium hirsutum]
MISTKSTYGNYIWIGRDSGPTTSKCGKIEQRQRQLRNQRERRGPLNPRQKDDDAGSSTRLRHSSSPSSMAIQSPSPTRAPTQSPDPAVQPTIPTLQPFQMMPGWSQWPDSAPFPVMPSGPPMYRPTEYEGSQEEPSGSSYFYQSPPPNLNPRRRNYNRHRKLDKGRIQRITIDGRHVVDHRPKSDNQIPYRKNQNPHRRNNNRRRNLEKGGIQSVTIDGRHVALNLPGTDIDCRI